MLSVNVELNVETSDYDADLVLPFNIEHSPFNIRLPLTTMRSPLKRLLVTIALVFTASNAFAWGQAGHLMSNEAATIGLPNDMPQFFYRQFPQLIWLGPDPDRWRNGGPALEASNSPDHQLNYEYVASMQLPRDRYSFVALLTSSGTLRRYGISNIDPGFLPWRIAEMCEQLTVEWRLWRAAAPGSPDRVFIERDIIRDSGVLGHFVADSQIRCTTRSTTTAGSRPIRTATRTIARSTRASRPTS
jgi:hypothetical protein